MLKEILKDDFIQLDVDALDYKDAIKKTLSPLLDNGYIKECYYDAIIENLKNYGPYIDLGKNIALPHARPENGVQKTGISFCRLNENVNLMSDEHSIKIFFGLAAVDNDAHLEALSQLVTILNDDNNVEILKNGTKDEIIKLINK